MIRVFVGFDFAESVAYHTLCHSILRRSSRPVAFTPIGNEVLPEGAWWRPRGPHDSTEFSNARFMTPWLCGYKGWAIFMDCDMLCNADLADLWEQRDPSKAVQVVKHNHQPKEETKFLGQPQSQYSRKNWSSLMILNCSHPACQALTPRYVNNAAGLDLHGFAWCNPDDIGEIQGPWNVLAVGPETYDHPVEIDPEGTYSLMHYTRGGPWHGVYDLGWDDWVEEFKDMLGGGNPRATANTILSDGMLVFHGGYHGAKGN